MDFKRIPYAVQEKFSVFENTMVEMTWQEVQTAADRGAVALLPIGIVEGHGPHLDLSADFYLATLNCRFVQQELREKGIEAVIAPPFYWGISTDVAKYAGTFSVRPETMRALLTDIFLSLKSWGFKRVFVQNGHGDQTHVQIIREVIHQVNESADFRVYFMWDLDVAIESELVLPTLPEDIYQPDYHAGAIETAQVAAFFPEKVRQEVAKKLLPQNQFDPYAYVGDPANYEAVKIEEYAYIDTLLDVLRIEAILKWDR